VGTRDRAGRPLAVDRQRRLLRRHGRPLRRPAAAGVLTALARPAAVRFGPVEISFDESVLRPRPWTLAQSEWAAELVGDGAMVELGCGAGQIGLAATALSGRPLVQVDRDAGACRWAAHNAAANGCADLVEHRCGTADEVLADDERFAVVIADPPYVPSAEVALYPEDPPAAIDGGADGLGLVRAFLTGAWRHLGPGASIVLQLRGLRQVAELETWLAHPSSPPLVVTEARTYGDLRALARLEVRAGAA
jgi:release factor glutamine methyltransferase